MTKNNITEIAKDKQKSIFFTLLGCPNAGKSTLINKLVGQKISIVTPKVQTTRNRVRGIVIEKEVQIVITDTPGIFTPKQNLEKSIVKSAWGAVKESDLLALVVDVKKGLTPDNVNIIKYIKENNKKAILILNKIDKIMKDQLLPIAKQINGEANFLATFMISAQNGDGVEGLKQFICSQAENIPWCFSSDEITDMPIKFWAAEVVREKLFMNLEEELPYNIAVETESYKELKRNTIRLDLVIYVSRDSQKKIILGKNGSLIKEIGILARRELEKSLDKNVQLFLFVKVKENWQEKPMLYKELGLETP